MQNWLLVLTNSQRIIGNCAEIISIFQLIVMFPAQRLYLLVSALQS